MAGTANDYVGTLAETRSGRVCENWPTDYDFTLQESDELVPATVPTTSQRTRRITLVKPIKHKPQVDPYGLFVHGKTTTPSVPKYATKSTTRYTPVSKIKLGKTIARERFNDSLYPDGSAANASNYCRNPSRNIAGTWCYTTDFSVPQDLCNVRDCEKPGETAAVNS